MGARRGIDRVDVAIDDGPWLMAELAAEDTIVLAPMVVPVGGDIG
jgi:hypothetical protein